MIRKFTIILAFILLSLYCKGQGLNLTFSPVITYSQDSSIKAIASLWEDYLNSVNEGRSDSIQRSYWHNESEDLIKYLSWNSILYQFGEQLTFSIRKYSDTIYEIHTLLQLVTLDNSDFNILYIYKTCAVETEGRFKLLNYFDVHKHSLQNYNSEHIEFYYPYGFSFDIEKVKSTERFINWFWDEYHIKKQSGKIICVIGNNLSESNSFIGFDFTVATSEKKYAGLHIFPRTVITCRQDHIHEFIHAIMYPEYPEALSILHEGIATYYGGTSGSDYIFHRKNLQKHLYENTIDFSDSSLFWSIEIEGVPLAYIFGALIIEYALENHGTHKVIELFSCKEYPDILSKLEIKPENANDFFTQFINGK